MTREAAENDAKSKEQKKRIKKLERALNRAEERLEDYENLVDRTQHLLNVRINELESARAELRARGADLQLSEQRFRQLADAAFEAILITRGTEIIDCNAASRLLYGRSKEQLVGASVLDLLQESFVAELQHHMAQHSDEAFEQSHRHASGHTIPVEIRIKQIEKDPDGMQVIAVRDITEHRQMEEQLRHLASTDDLTGTNNRRHFMSVGTQEYLRSVRYNQPLSVMMLDVDHFKRINDNHGHDVGDQALKILTCICTDSLRASDFFGRLGGEEFAMLLPSTGAEGAALMANRLRQHIADTPIPTSHGALNMTVSIGVAQMDTAIDDSIDTMLNRADKALYAAKNSGRNRVVYA